MAKYLELSSPSHVVECQPSSTVPWGNDCDERARLDELHFLESTFYPFIRDSVTDELGSSIRRRSTGK